MASKMASPRNPVRSGWQRRARRNSLEATLVCDQEEGVAKQLASVLADLILLSFFDGLGSASLICEHICKEQSWRCRALAWETDDSLVKLMLARFKNVEHRGDFDVP